MLPHIKGGHLTLIRAILSNLSTYYLSLFKAPISVCKEIEKLMRNFLWEGTDAARGSHLIKWDLITHPKDTGGLGINRIRVANDALLGK